MKPLFIDSMHGIGDNLYQRPFIKILAKQREVYIATPLPELLSDIDNVFFVRPNETYRTQQKHIEKSKITFVDMPKEYDTVNPFYNGEDLTKYSLIYSMARKFNVNDFELANLSWDLPKFNIKLNGIDDIPQKIAVIRANSIRKEWQVTTRSCDPVYLEITAKILKEAGYFIITIADTKDDEEWIEGNPPFSHLKLHKGELGILGTLELIKRAHLTVGSSGFIVPASISAGTNHFTVFGGRGTYDSPYKIFHPSMNMKKLGWAVPDKHCMCTLNDHKCNKTINNFDTHFLNFLKQIQND